MRRRIGANRARRGYFAIATSKRLRTLYAGVIVIHIFCAAGIAESLRRRAGRAVHISRKAACSHDDRRQTSHSRYKFAAGSRLADRSTSPTPGRAGNAGMSIATRIAMMPMTTRSSDQGECGTTISGSKCHGSDIKPESIEKIRQKFFAPREISVPGQTPPRNRWPGGIDAILRNPGTRLGGVWMVRATDNHTVRRCSLRGSSPGRIWRIKVLV